MMQPAKHNFRLEIISNLEEIEEIIAWFEECHQSHIPEKIWLQAETVLIEGFTNVVRHAHANQDTETLINLELEIGGDYLQIKIWDQGIFFDLTSALHNLDQKIRSSQIDLWERESQWGFIFFLKLRDEFGWKIDYTQESDQRNCLKIQSPKFD